MVGGRAVASQSQAVANTHVCCPAISERTSPACHTAYLLQALKLPLELLGAAPHVSQPMRRDAGIAPSLQHVRHLRPFRRSRPWEDPPAPRCHRDERVWRGRRANSRMMSLRRDGLKLDKGTQHENA